MSSEKLSKIIKILLYALALTPLILTPSTIFPFNFGRGLITQFLIEIIFALFLILAIFDRNYRPKISPGSAVLGIFLSLLFLSSLFGVHFYKSFWSTEERFDGWLYLAHAFAAYLILISVFKNRNEWRKFLAFNVLAALLGFALAAFSFFNIKFWGADLGYWGVYIGKRISGTLGNPLFFATYAILNLIFCAFLIFNCKRRFGKIFFALAGIVLIYGVSLTQSRGALLGLVAGALAGLIVYGLISRSRGAKMAIAAGFAAVLIAALLLPFARRTEFVQHNSVLKRITNFSLEDTASTRFIGWRIAAKAILERPILGWGMGGFDVAFNKYFNPASLKYSYYETWFDKPHNKVLEAAVDGGIFGLAAYLSVFVAAGFAIWKKTLKGELGRGEAAALSGGLAAYFTQNLFIFDTNTSYLVFFILLAFIFHSEREPSPPVKIPILVPALALSVAVCFGGVLNISPFLASAKMKNAVYAADGETAKGKVSLEAYEAAEKYFNPYKQEWRVDLAKSAISDLRKKGGIYNDDEIKFILEEAERIAAENPESAYGHMFLGSFYSELGAEDAKYFDLAKQELDKALALSPERQQVFFALGRLYGLEKDKKMFIETFKKAIDLEPGASRSYWEGGRQLYLLDQSDPLWREWMLKSLDLGYLPEDDGEFLFVFKNFLAHFLGNKNYNVLSSLYMRMSQIEPAEAKWHAQGAVAAFMKGDKAAAMREVRTAMSLDESYREEGEEFIKIIESEK